MTNHSFTKPHVYNLSRMTLKDMSQCGAALRRLGTGSLSMEETASRTVRFLYDSLVGGETGEHACVLVRCFKTHPLGELDARLQQLAGGSLGAEPASPAMQCLTLLGTAGDLPEWNSRRASAGQQVIPLPSALGVARIPMIAQLIKQLGLEVSSVLRPDPKVVIDLQQKSFNVFYVPEALGSPYIPAQQGFVIPYGVRSVLGFGGVLPRGDLFAVIMFVRVPLPPRTAELFKPLALSAKLAILPVANGPLFDA
ncbi:MAG: hypothetical protein M3434_07025 [Gemmatimonadota bacterium]|nr:hypothetical protein [Gemmatimonadota bacterium]